MSDSTDIEGKIREACAKLTSEDSYLFSSGINERTLTARLAMYLREMFPEYDVDCEYNRNCGEPDLKKRLHDKDYAEAKKKRVPMTDDKGLTVFPDIIVHKRGEWDKNLLVIEAKKSNNREKIIDRKKLKAYLSDTHLKYKFGCFVEFGVKIGEEPSYKLEMYQPPTAP